MSMTGWRVMYWMFFAVGVIGVAFGTAVLLRAARHQRRNVLIAAAVALVLAGLSGTLIVAAAGPGGFGHNMMGMGGMGMMGNRSAIGPPPAASPGASTQAVNASEFAF